MQWEHFKIDSTDILATAAIFNPLWTEQLEHGLSITLTILGILWLSVQIYYKIRNRGIE